LNVSILCSSNKHPVYDWLVTWASQNTSEHVIEIVNDQIELSGGHLLFLVSCNEIVKADVRCRYKATLVIHASDLPEGRGWSPHIWQVLSGCNEITVTIFEAEDTIDNGSIWAKRKMRLEGHELYDEINAKLFSIETELMDFVLQNWKVVKPYTQSKSSGEVYRKRTLLDSKLDPNRTIAEQFDLMRVADPDRYPTFFDFRGHRYVLTLRKSESSSV